MPTAIKRVKSATVAKRLRHAAAVAAASTNGGGPPTKKRKAPGSAAAGLASSGQQLPAKKKGKKLPQTAKRAAAAAAEEVTSESDVDASDVGGVGSGVDDDYNESLETPQETRVRLAQHLIGELKAREAERLGYGDNDDEEEEGDDEEGEDDHEVDAAVTGAVSARLQAANLRRAGRHRASLAASVADAAAVEAADVARNWHRLAVTCAQLGRDALFTASKDGSVARWSLQAAAVGDSQCRHLRREAHAPGGIRPRRRHQAAKASKKAAAAADGGGGGEVLHRGHVLCMALSADQSRLATGDADGLVLVWEAGQLRRLHEFRGHRGAVTALAFRRGGGSGLHLFSGSQDKTVRHWGLGGAPDCGLGFMEALFGHSSAVLGLDSMRLERCLSCGGPDRSLRLWKLTDESQLVFELPPGGGPNSCECVAMVTEQVFASGQGDGSLCVWSAQKKRPMCRRPEAHGPDRWVTSLAAVKNSDLLASGSWDGHVRLWRLLAADSSLAAVRSLPAPGFVNQLAFSPASADEGDEDGDGGVFGGLRLAAALGQEHKWGRWLVDKSARNLCLVWRLAIAARPAGH